MSMTISSISSLASTSASVASITAPSSQMRPPVAEVLSQAAQEVGVASAASLQERVSTQVSSEAAETASTVAAFSIEGGKAAPAADLIPKTPQVFRSIQPYIRPFLEAYLEYSLNQVKWVMMNRKHSPEQIEAQMVALKGVTPESLEPEMVKALCKQHLVGRDWEKLEEACSSDEIGKMLQKLKEATDYNPIPPEIITLTAYVHNQRGFRPIEKARFQAVIGPAFAPSLPSSARAPVLLDLPTAPPIASLAAPLFRQGNSELQFLTKKTALVEAAVSQNEALIDALWKFWKIVDFRKDAKSKSSVEESPPQAVPLNEIKESLVSAFSYASLILIKHLLENDPDCLCLKQKIMGKCAALSYSPQPSPAEAACLTGMTEFTTYLAQVGGLGIVSEVEAFKGALQLLR